jgi:hypothetical protein
MLRSPGCCMRCIHRGMYAMYGVTLCRGAEQEGQGEARTAARCVGVGGCNFAGARCLASKSVSFFFLVFLVFFLRFSQMYLWRKDFRK